MADPIRLPVPAGVPVNHTLEWLQDRIKQSHHQAISKYLCWRGMELQARDEAAGLDVNLMLRESFHVRNGWTSVPKAAMKVLKRVQGTDPSLVWAFFSESDSKSALGAWRPHGLLYMRAALKACRERDPEFASKCDLIEAEMTVREVMEK